MWHLIIYPFSFWWVTYVVTKLSSHEFPVGSNNALGKTSKKTVKFMTFIKLGLPHPLVYRGLLWHTARQGLVKGAILCFRNPYFYFWNGESTSTASQLTSPASQKSKDLNKVLLLLQDLGDRPPPYWKNKLLLNEY